MKTILEFKRRMSFEEMKEHMSQNSCEVANRVSVGRYARKHGYRPYKPMIARKVYFFYVNEDIPLKKP